MLERTDQHTLQNAKRRETNDTAVGLAFLGTVGIAMTAWIAAILWVSWRLIAWIFF
ncbi:RNA-binding protein [Bradyrhizobium amphicarpaeae]|uniref:RNA-binding protein n=1 Tax=Bradyrhizobium amphicarpaeae TaxID=1404768 RepID=A0A2U8Q429_9BRAD|nr:RNA-binding protein [Bradyrhizobium amphicarpaeae]AWM04890.1 RNA-binding protein [Bradyrhizobium amphicarpaeae]